MKYTASVDIGGTNTRVALIDENYTVVERVSFSTDSVSPSVTIERIAEVVMSFDHEIVGIGVSCPGPLDLINGVVLTPPNLKGWHGYRVEHELSQLTQLKVYLENDANLAGLAEATIGAGVGMDYVQYFTISTGVGGGFTVKQEIFHGARGYAQEVANVILKPNGFKLNDLQAGSLESLCSGTAITARGVAEGLSVSHAGEVNDLALAGNVIAAQIMDDAKEYLANAIATVYGFLDPNIVVLGGGVALKIDGFVEDVEARVKTKVFEIMASEVRVVKAELGEDNGILGGGILAFNKYRVL